MSAKTIAEKMCRLGGNFFNHDQAILPARYPNSVYNLDNIITKSAIIINDSQNKQVMLWN